MNKREYLAWIERLEAQGYDDAEIDAIVQDYLDQPSDTAWFHEEY